MNDLDSALSEKELEQFLQSAYPLPGDKGKPVKIAADELDSIVLLPKGYKAPGGQQMEEDEDEEKKKEEEEEDEEEDEQQKRKPDMADEEDEEDEEDEDDKGSNMKRKMTQLKEENADLKQKLEGAMNLVQQLKGRLEEIDTAERTTLAEQICDIKIENDLLSEDNKAESIKELIKLEQAQLKTLLSEVRALLLGTVPERKRAKPQTQLSEKEKKEMSTPLELSMEERKARKVRDSMFGHEEPIEEYLVTLSKREEDYAQG